MIHTYSESQGHIFYLLYSLNSVLLYMPKVFLLFWCIIKWQVSNPYYNTGFRLAFALCCAVLQACGPAFWSALETGRALCLENRVFESHPGQLFSQRCLGSCTTLHNTLPYSLQYAMIKMAAQFTGSCHRSDMPTLWGHTLSLHRQFFQLALRPKLNWSTCKFP